MSGPVRVDSVLLLPNLMIMYPVAAALRERVERIAMGLEPSARIPGLPSHRALLARTRFVDELVDVPAAPALDGAWTSGRASAYSDSVLRTCLRLGLDSVLGGTDAQVHALTVSAHKFALSGVRVLHASPSATATLSDKYLLTRAAQRAGLVVPRTAVLGTPEASESGLDFGYPLIVKRRYAQGGDGVHLVENGEEMEALRQHIVQRDSLDAWIVQEYVRGSVEPSITYWRSDDSAVLRLFHLKHRYLGTGASTAVEVVAPFTDPFHVDELFRSVGAVGHFGMQFKFEEHTGVPKLIEVNARLGQNTRLLLPMLENAGDLILAPFGAELHERTASVEHSTTSVSPFDDLLTLRVLRRARSVRERPDNPTPSYAALARSIIRTYFRPRVRFDSLWRLLWREPLVVLGLYRRLTAAIRAQPVQMLPWGLVARKSAAPTRDS